MTAVASIPIERRRQGMKVLAGALALVCVALLSLALEQRHAVATAQAVRAALVAGVQVRPPAVPGADPFATTDRRLPGALAAAPEDIGLSGSFDAAGSVTGQSLGTVIFTGARVTFGSGETLHTQPIRIAEGREFFSQGRTYADLWSAPSDAQVELRSVDRSPGAPSSAEPSVCRPDRPGALALLHRRNRVDLVVFREGTTPGPETATGDICGVWRFQRR